MPVFAGRTSPQIASVELRLALDVFRASEAD